MEKKWRKEEDHQARSARSAQTILVSREPACCSHTACMTYVKEAHVLLFLVLVPGKGIYKHVACVLGIMTLAASGS